MGQLQHPNILPVYELGLTEEQEALLHDAARARPDAAGACSTS